MRLRRGMWRWRSWWAWGWAWVEVLDGGDCSPKGLARAVPGAGPPAVDPCPRPAKRHCSVLATRRSVSLEIGATARRKATTPSFACLFASVPYSVATLQPMDPRTRRLAEAPVGKLLLTFSLPAVAGMLVMSLYVVIDRMFLGHTVGPDAIGGLSICMPVSFVMMAVGMLIGFGSGALVSIHLGKQKKDDAEAVLGNAMTLIAIASFVLSTTFLLALDPLLTAFGATARTLPHARAFLSIILLGSFFQFTSFGLNAIIRAEGNPRLAMFTQLISAGLNIVLDAIFIYGFGFGVKGAAVATVISQAVSALWTLAHFRSQRSVLRLRLPNMRLRWKVAAPALAIGAAPLCMQLAASFVTLLINRGASHYGGDAAVNAYGVSARWPCWR